MPLHILNLMQCCDLRFQSQMSRIAVVLISLQHLKLSSTEVTIIARWPGLGKQIQICVIDRISELILRFFFFFISLTAVHYCKRG